MMKKKFCHISILIALLILFSPFYCVPMFSGEINVSAPDGTLIRVYYSSDDPDDFKQTALFSVEKKQKLRFMMETRTLGSVKLEFRKASVSKVKAGVLSLNGKRKILTRYSSVREETEDKGKVKIYVFDDFPVLEAPLRFSFMTFLFVLAMAAGLSAAMVNSRTIRILCAVCAGYIGMALNCNISFSYLNPFYGVLICLFLFRFYDRVWKDGKVNFVLIASGVVFASVNILSTKLYFTDSWKSIEYEPFLNMTAIVGEAVFFYTAGGLFIEKFPFKAFFERVRLRSFPAKAVDYYERHTVLCAFLIILLLWLPWHFVYYPGIVPWDSKGQIKQVLGLLSKSQRHPVLSTALFGLFFRTGMTIKDMDLGFYLYTLFQTFVCAGVFALCLDGIRRMGFNTYYQAACLFFFSVYPVGGYMTVWIMKDILYAAAMTFFVLHTFGMVFLPREGTEKKTYVLYFLSFLSVCLLRRNGVFIAVPTAVSVLFLSGTPRPVKKRMLLLSVLGTAVFFTLNQAVFPALGYEKGLKKEALSVPFQQTARILKNYPNDLSYEEYETVQNVLNVRKSKKRYCPYKSDFVKATYKLANDPRENEKLAAYLRTAAKMFFRHPVTAVQATMANSFGYYAFTPFFFIEQEEPVDFRFYTAYPEFTEPFRDFIDMLSSDEVVTPLLYTGERPPVYVWCLILIGIYFITAGQYRFLILLLPSMLSTAICVASPINGLLRYMLPVIMSFPVVLSFTLMLARREKENGEKE